MISMTSHNDTRIVSNFSKVGGPEEYIETQNGVYRMEMKNITDEAIQQIEDLAISTACGSESIDIQKTITRIGGPSCINYSCSQNAVFFLYSGLRVVKLVMT